MNIVISRMILVLGMIALSFLLFYIFAGAFTTETMKYDVLARSIKESIIEALAKGKSCIKGVSFNNVEVRNYTVVGEISIFLNVSIESVGLVNPKIYGGLLRLNTYIFKDPRLSFSRSTLESIQIIYNTVQPFYVDYSTNYVSIISTINYDIKEYSDGLYINMEIYEVNNAYLVINGDKKDIEHGKILNDKYDVCIISYTVPVSDFVYNYTWIGPSANLTLVFSSDIWNHRIDNIYTVTTGEKIYLSIRVFYIDIYLTPA